MGFDHGVGHPLLLLYDAKVPNCQKHKEFKDLGHYSEWPKVADAVIKARKCIFNAGMIPNITKNPRNRKRPKRGRKRIFNEAIHALRMRVERTFAWEDKFKRLLLRFEHIQQRHYGMKLMAYTLMNLREFCST